MKIFVALLITGMLVAGPALAQQNPPAAPPPATETKSPEPALTKSGKPKAKDVRAQCLKEAKSKGLKGEDRSEAVEDCFLKARPDLAVAEECRTDAKLKNLDKDARMAAVKECVKSKK
jgi:hypothetical protein